MAQTVMISMPLFCTELKGQMESREWEMEWEWEMETGNGNGNDTIL